MIEIKQVTGLDEREREGYDRTRETLRETELGGERVSLHLGFSRSFLPFSSFPPPPSPLPRIRGVDISDRTAA